MSSGRSSSAVRDLRSIFENKASENSDQIRGRSTSGLGSDSDTSRPRSTVRASFFPVQSRMATDMEGGAAADLQRETSTEVRRGSFSEGKAGSALDDLRNTMAMGQEKESDEIAIASPVATPLVEVNRTLGSDTKIQKVDKPAENPDKHLTGAEEDPATMKPADPADEEAVSGGKGLPPVEEDLRKQNNARATKTSKATPTAKPPAASKLSSISTKDSAKPSTTSTKSPVTRSKSPQSPKVTLSKRTSRSSLTAPTAAWAARSAGSDRASGANVKTTSPSSKPKPREVTKPVNLPSHLTAPTAASRAKHEPSTEPSNPLTTARVKAPSNSTQPTPRASLGAPPSSSHPTEPTRKNAAPVDNSFLERMMRPTAASASKTAKPESAPTTKASPARPRTAKLPRPATKEPPVASSKPEPDSVVEEPAVPEPEELPEEPIPVPKKDNRMVEELEPEPTLPTASAVEPVTVPKVAVSEEPKGSETPQTNGHQGETKDITLESTPAAIGGQETIR